MFFEIGLRAASKIPKGVVFGSLPTRLIKSQNNLEDHKIGFVEVRIRVKEVNVKYNNIALYR